MECPKGHLYFNLRSGGPFLKGRRISCYLYFLGIYASLFTPREHCMTISHHSIKIQWPTDNATYTRRMMGKLGVYTVEYTTAFLYCDWVYFLWRGVKFYYLIPTEPSWTKSPCTQSLCTQGRAYITWRVQFQFSCKMSVEFSTSSFLLRFDKAKIILHNLNPTSSLWLLPG